MTAKKLFKLWKQDKFQDVPDDVHVIRRSMIRWDQKTFVMRKTTSRNQSGHLCAVCGDWALWEV